MEDIEKLSACNVLSDCRNHAPLPVITPEVLSGPSHMQQVSRPILVWLQENAKCVVWRDSQRTFVLQFGLNISR
ncbi:hypothetical protein MAR_025648 [Mya arenaria]|uniref:Uncharacterized protein n=1 Tax=Mya arenaria TaxID=6604 RepID=A0ABY7ESC8_MYAAR|nr:hypothetical protein MAR_025648 [Mya arenaria]